MDKDELSLKIHSDDRQMEEIRAQRFNQKLFRNTDSLYFYDYELDNSEEKANKKEQ